MRTIAIIPARGGSKGIPRKNALPLCGKPLVAWSIHQAQDSDFIEHVYVTTDDEDIAGIAESCGADVIHRPAELATDTASTDDAVHHALMHTKEEAELVVLLQPTSPIRQPNAIDEAISLLLDSKADSLFSGRIIEGFAWTEGYTRWIASYQLEDRPRRQDLPRRQVEENGSIYVFKPELLETCKSRLGGKVACYLQSPLDSFQIDTPTDWELIEQLLPLRLGVQV